MKDTNVFFTSCPRYIQAEEDGITEGGHGPTSYDRSHVLHGGQIGPVPSFRRGRIHGHQQWSNPTVIPIGFRFIRFFMTVKIDVLL